MQQFTLRAFNASGNYARENSVDYTIHLGDYIYEDKNGDNGLSATKQIKALK
jgi:phosphodiesterase/alkaline phosphatase D-like protein